MISIVTPSLNQGRFVDSAIRSVIDQRYPHYEHIVIDGGSTDETLAVLARYQGIPWLSEPDAGQSDALNKGFRKVRGDIVGWLNADDLYLPDCFRRVSEYLLARPEVDVVFGDYRLIDESGKVVRPRRELSYDPFMLKYLHVLYIPSASTFFRRQIFDEGNYLNTDYHYAMDYEFFLRLAVGGCRFAHVDAFLADFRHHGASKSSLWAGRQRAEQEAALVTHDAFIRRIGDPQLRKVVRRTLEVAARGKRYFLKFARGDYMPQWHPGRQA